MRRRLEAQNVFHVSQRNTVLWRSFVASSPATSSRKCRPSDRLGSLSDRSIRTPPMNCSSSVITVPCLKNNGSFGEEKPKYIPPLFALVSSACLVLLMGLWLLNEGIWLGLYRKLHRGISTSIEEWWKWLLLLDGGKHVVLEVFLWLFLTPVLLVLGRTMLFIFTHLFCARGLWLFPNLLMDDEFLAIFYPLFEWDRHPKESLGLRWKQFRNRMKAEMGLGSKHRKKRKRKISRTALKKAVMYRKES